MELTRFRYRDGIPRPERPWTEPTWAITTYFERRGNDDWTRVYGSERWEERYELPMVNDVGSKLISIFVLHQQFNLLFAGSGATMAGVASPPPTSTSAQPIPTDTSGQTLPHLPPFTVHFDHLTSSPYHPRITPQEHTYDPLIVQKSLTNIPLQSQSTTMTTPIPSP